MMDFLESVKRI